MAITGVTNYTNTYAASSTNTANKDKVEKANTSAARTKNAGTEKTQAAEYVDKSKEQALSRQAQDVLKQLRDKYGDMDFIVADFKNAEEAKAALSKGTKEFSVLFSSEELEKMASDEKYLKQKMQGIDGAVRMSEEINQKYGFERTFGKEGTTDTEIVKIGIAFNDDGTTSFFAELEKLSAKQRERIKEAKEEKRAEKKAAEKKDEKELQSYAKSSADTKRATIQADSIEELVEKIREVDWENVKFERVPENGSRFNYSI